MRIKNGIGLSRTTCLTLKDQDSLVITIDYKAPPLLVRRGKQKKNKEWKYRLTIRQGQEVLFTESFTATSPHFPLGEMKKSLFKSKSEVISQHQSEIIPSLIDLRGLLSGAKRKKVRK